MKHDQEFKSFPHHHIMMWMCAAALILTHCTPEKDTADTPAFERIELTIEHIGGPGTFTGAMGQDVVMALAPGVFVVTADSPDLLFTPGADASPELEALAEAGDPVPLLMTMKASPEVSFAALTGDIDNVDYEESPILPGAKTVLSIRYQPGDTLGLAMMLGPSNDTFLGSRAGGIALDELMEGDVPASSVLLWWDAGTEIDEPPGEGMYQLSSTMGTEAGPAQDLPISPAELVDAQGAMRLPEVNAMVRLTVKRF